MPNQPTVDIILPNLNKRRFIEECLQSLLRQTYTNWRCIVVDGNSDDGSWEIIQQVAQYDARFELHQPGRLGLYPSWNYGLEKVEHSLFTFLTSDDVWESKWLETAVRILGETPRAVAAAAQPVYIDEASSYIETPTLAQDAYAFAANVAPQYRVGRTRVQRRPGPMHAAMVYALGSVPITMHALVMLGSLAELEFATDVGSIADREWYLRMGLAGDICYTPDCRAYLRRYSDQATSVTQTARRDELARSVRRILDRNRDKVRARLSVSPSTFDAADREIRRLFDFIYMRPSVEMMRVEPAQALKRLLNAFRSHPRLTIREILGLLVRKKYSRTRQFEVLYMLFHS